MERETEVSTEQRILGRDRAELDELDTQIAALIQRRGAVVRRIHDDKADHGLGARDWDREQEVFARLDSHVGAYPAECLRQVWSVLMFWAPATRAE